ncbi:MAG: hypothetical protein KKG93_17430 [Bacteroidetes bacterium]|nr:hypothetical protein [Bacteroidota bacterium]
MRKILLTIFSVLFFISLSVSAQTFEETMAQLSADAGSAYVNPIGAAFGSNMNSGWFSGVPEAQMLGLDLELKISIHASMFSDDAKNFKTSGKFQFSSDQTKQLLGPNPSGTGNAAANQAIYDAFAGATHTVAIAGPTVVGSKDEFVTIGFASPTVTVAGQTYNLQQQDIALTEVKGIGNELPALPQPSAQLTIGTVFGTTASFRYFPTVAAGDFGDISFFGYGVTHNPAMWLPVPLPVDIGIGFYTQTLELGKIFESTATQFGVFASKEFGFIISVTPYIGLTMETSTTTLKYNQTFTDANGKVIGTPIPIKFELEGDNDLGITAGLKLDLFLLQLYADYKMATTSTISAGLMMGF